MLRTRTWYIRINPQRYGSERTMKEVKSLVRDTDLGKIIQLQTKAKRVEVIIEVPEMGSYENDRELIRGVFKDHFEYENYALILAIRPAKQSDL